MRRHMSHAVSASDALAIREPDQPSRFERTSSLWKRKQAKLRRNEAFLAQAQRLTKTGSIWLKPSTGEVAWSEETYRLMEYPLGVTPTVELALARCHPDDLPWVRDTLAAAVRDGLGVDFEYRLLMPSGTLKHVRLVFQNVAGPGEEEDQQRAEPDRGGREPVRRRPRPASAGAGRSRESG